MIRFNFNANTKEEAKNYLLNRATQLLKYNVRLISMEEKEELIDAVLEHNSIIYHSVYLFKDYRGKGIYKKYVQDNNYKIITHTNCNLAEYLEINNIPFIFFGSMESLKEYKLIEEFYGDDKAKRSEIYLMNHIDEGLAILNSIGASIEAKRAYCLHPIFQSNENVLDSVSKSNLEKLNMVSKQAIINVMEYRSVANEYLSHRNINSINEIRLSPLKDVNDMLIADKIQNYKDFELYHKETHKRSEELNQYFLNWLERLKIPMEEYRKFLDTLTIKPKIYERI